jgi:hypothetical protein
MLEEVTGAKRPMLKLPPALMYGIASVVSPILTRFFPHVPQRFTPGAVRILGMHRRADISKSKDELGYQPTSMREAIQSAYDWQVAQGWVKAPKRPASRTDFATYFSPGTYPPAAHASADTDGKKRRGKKTVQPEA